MKTHLRRFWIGLSSPCAPLSFAKSRALCAPRCRLGSKCRHCRSEQYDARLFAMHGAPHIYGKRDIDVAFGLSYAHAEDDFKTMQQMIPFYRGELAARLA